jgi:hypothetical protein
MPRPLILFGPCDRHNFGDLLFAHIATALLPGRELIVAGLAARDLRAYGGHAVRALDEVRTTLGARPVDLLHIGGEILTCTAWQAAVILQSPQEAPALITYLEHRPAERAAWVRRMLATGDDVPYAVDRRAWPALRRVLYGGVGGVALAQCEPALRAEVQAKLAAADAVGVRDAETQRQLQAAGVATQLLPDPAVMVAELFADRLHDHAVQCEVAQMQRQFPQGFLAVQCSEDFSDDATLTQLAAQLTQIIRDTGLGLVLLRAGAAPWHDTLATLQRLATRLERSKVRVFESLHLWDICALIAASRGFAGSSLHGRIVATVCALPHASLRSPASGTQQGKTAAWAATWEGAAADAVVDAAALAPAMLHALGRAPAARRQLAQELAQRYRRGFERLCDSLDEA